MQLSNEAHDNKEKIVSQFVVDSKSSAPVTENKQLCTVYRMELDDSDGYESDFTVNSEGTFQFNTNSTMFSIILKIIFIKVSYINY